jgi:hypothetical protein
MTGLNVEVEERTQHYWVGTAGDIILVFAYPDSHEDPGAIKALGRTVEKYHRKHHRRAKVLFVLPTEAAKPPDANVRKAIVEVAKAVETLVERVAVVIGGTGFGAAIHRGALTGIMAMVRPSVPVKVANGVREGLELLWQPPSHGLEVLAAYCADLARGPAAG